MKKVLLKDLLINWHAGDWGDAALEHEKGVSVLRSTNFRAGGYLSFENEAVLSIDAKALTKKRLQPGDILLERSGGGPLQPVGRVAIFQGGKHDRYICGNFISRLTLRRELVAPEYLLYRLLSWHNEGVTEKFQTATTGIRNLQMKEYLNQELWLHPLEKQLHIAAELKTQLAAIEEARQAAQSQLNEIRLLKTQALKAVFAAIEASAPLGDVARIQSGYAFKSETFQKHGVRLLRNANIAPGRLHWDDAVFLAPGAAEAHAAYALTEGDVLISLDRPIIKTGIKVTRVTATDLPALLVQRVGRFRIDATRLNADYLYAFLHTEPFIDAISGHEQSLGVPHISPGQIEAIDLPLPTLPEQQRLAVILNNIAEATHEAQRAAEQQLRDIELLPSRLLAQVFDTQGDTQNDE